MEQFPSTTASLPHMATLSPTELTALTNPQSSNSSTVTLSSLEQLQDFQTENEKVPQSPKSIADKESQRSDGVFISKNEYDFC